MKIKKSPPLADSLTTQGQVGRTRLTWSDFQIVLAIARLGSVARASAGLAVTHATLLRNLAAIETRLNTRLFDRTRGRYTTTTAGQALAEAAGKFEPLARDAELQVLGQDLRPSGEVRIAAASIVIEQLLPPVLGQFAGAFPDVRIEMIASREHVSLTRREADVAIRVADRVPEWLVGRKLAVLQFAVYSLKRSGMRVALREPAMLAVQQRWIGFERDTRDLKFDRWLHEFVPDASVVLRVDNFSHALAMVRGGLGVALLPTFLESTCPELQRLSGPISDLETPLWLITHKELRNTMRVKVLMQAFGAALSNTLQGR